MKVYLDTIGCRLNQAEIEQYARQMRLAGHTLVGSPAEADLAIVNTCAVTAAAVSDSRQKLRQLERQGIEQIVVTGCWATLSPAEAIELPAVTRVIPNAEKDQLVPRLLKISPQEFDQEPLERQPIPGARLRTRTFIKVQDGCNNRCAYCITSLARGRERSRPIPEVLADIHAAGDSKEIVLTGVHLGSWGHDLSPSSRLQHLVQAILDETDAPRIRLSSLEPWDLEADFFQLWENPRLCRHLHLPLQSGSAATLQRMRRKTTPASFAGLLSTASSYIPDIAITTDVIAGFPGETETEFQESLDFVRQCRFAGGHVFTYSARPGTAAARIPEQVPHATRKRRGAQMRSALAESAQAYRSGFIGKVLSVLWESASPLDAQGWEMSGLTGNYIRLTASSPRSLWNQITPVHITGLSSDGMSGQIV